MTADAAIEQGLAHALRLGELGVQVAAYRDGELIVDAWAGHADAARTRPVSETTIFPILSAVKAATAVAVHLQAERSRLDYDAPVARYWPAFGAAGKAGITVGQVLCHRAGVPQLPAGTTIDRVVDWEAMTAAIAAMAPIAPPGSINAYHALSWGWILGEVVRRTDPERRPFGRLVAEEVCAPLGIDGLWIGLPEADEPRCAEVVSASYPGPPAARAPLRRFAVPSRLGPPQEFQNLPAFHRACVPAGSGIADARSLARLYAMLAGGGALDGVRLLSPERVAWLLTPRPGLLERDAVMGDVRPAGRGGFQLGAHPGAPSDPVLGDARRVLWHPGGGGTYGWADLDSGLAVAICHNRMLASPTVPGPTGPEAPFAELARAVRASAASGQAGS